MELQGQESTRQILLNSFRWPKCISCRRKPWNGIFLVQEPKLSMTRVSLRPSRSLEITRVHLSLREDPMPIQPGRLSRNSKRSLHRSMHHSPDHMQWKDGSSATAQVTRGSAPCIQPRLAG